MSEHTPTPWSLAVHTGRSGRIESDRDDWTISGPGGESICWEGGPNPNASHDAAFIVLAVNNHDALVDVVKLLLHRCGPHASDRAVAEAVLDALTNSEGGGE